MKTQIKKWGDSRVLVLSQDFLKFNNAVVGDWVDLSEAYIVRPNQIDEEDLEGNEDGED